MLLFLAAQHAYQLQKFYFLGFIGIWRYLWQLTHFIRSDLYLKVIWPAMRKQIDEHPDPYPKRLYFLIPSYGEKPATTEKMLRSVLSETLPIAKQVETHLVINLASDQERTFVREILGEYPGATESLHVTLMHQQDGKRMAIGHGLRAIAREFNNPLSWHKQTQEDLVVLMDGDSILEPGFLRRTLPLFKVRPDITAATTNNEVVSPEPDSLMHQWYNLKFKQRHFMFSSHSVSERVLTLTGRLSIYRAHNILTEDFIQAVESDYVDHWIFGRCPFLMGDDKSTWYKLLKQGCKMLYIPDVTLYCYEDRVSRFFKTTTGLFSRWYGNMLNNNGRAVAIGPRKLGFFIWWCLLDQKITCWTPLIGPVSMLILASTVSPAYAAYYAGWVVLSRSAYLMLLTRYGLKLNVIQLPLMTYNQWYGAFLKLVTLSRRDFQSWKAKDERLSKTGKTATLRESLSFQGFRTVARYGQLAASFSLLFTISYLLIFGIRIPESMHFSKGQRQEFQTIPASKQQPGKTAKLVKMARKPGAPHFESTID